jgi:hypothetical protein
MTVFTAARVHNTRPGQLEAAAKRFSYPRLQPAPVPPDQEQG